MATKNKQRAKFDIEGSQVEPIFKKVNGGLVSAASMAIVTKAQRRINDAKGLEKLISSLMPFVSEDKTDENAMMKAAGEAFKSGAISAFDMQKFAMSEEELEQKDDVFFSTKLASYCDILEGCLESPKLSASEFAESQTWETIKEVCEDFLESVRKK